MQVKTTVFFTEENIMKERKTFKEFCQEHNTLVLVSLLTIVAIAIFSGGYCFAWNVVYKPLDESQFELCERVAQRVYDQKGDFIIEAPEEVKISTTLTSITVEWAGSNPRGKVIARLENGELIMERDMEEGFAFGNSVLFGVLFVLCALIITGVICAVLSSREDDD